MHTVYVKDVLAEEYPGVIEDREEAGPRVFCFEQSGSCLDSAWELFFREEMRVWDSTLCQSQSAGRGRMRRAWHSPPGNIYAAWLWPRPGREWEPVVSLAVGYVLSRALLQIGVAVSLKWPNDLWFAGGKAGGVLVEEKQGVCMAGVGINVFHLPPLEQLRDKGLKKVSMLSSGLSGWSISGLWAYLVYQGRNWYERLTATCSPADFARKYEEIMAFRDEYVCLGTEKGEFCGIVRGISPGGEIRMHTEDGMRSFYSGSLILPEDGRRAYPG
jgi:BirA family biotin operon repressor/biotin-[acetyl-CoA-carboxylase] ligase